MPGPRIFGKSPGGTAAFVAVTWIVVGVLVVSGVTEFHRGLLIGGVVTALVELAPTPLDDNLTVPIAAGLAMHFLGV
jgi:dolichol kinase